MGLTTYKKPFKKSLILIKCTYQVPTFYQNQTFFLSLKSKYVLNANSRSWTGGKISGAGQFQELDWWHNIPPTGRWY